MMWNPFEALFYYIRNTDGTVYSSNDSEAFWQMYQDDKCWRIALTELAEGIEISTVFLGIDQSLGQNSDPVLYETLVFGGELADEMARYCTEAEARAGHERIVMQVQAWLKELSLIDLEHMTSDQFIAMLKNRG